MPCKKVNEPDLTANTVHSVQVTPLDLQSKYMPLPTPLDILLIFIYLCQPSSMYNRYRCPYQHTPSMQTYRCILVLLCNPQNWRPVIRFYRTEWLNWSNSWNIRAINWPRLRRKGWKKLHCSQRNLMRPIDRYGSRIIYMFWPHLTKWGLSIIHSVPVSGNMCPLAHQQMTRANC